LSDVIYGTGNILSFTHFHWSNKYFFT
jgi:hypothetical protein